MYSLITSLVGLLGLSSLAYGAPTHWVSRQSCNNYVIISTRGTGELQGPSAGFRGMIRDTLAQVPGGVEHDTIYPAAFNQQSQQGTADIINTVRSGLKSCPDQKFILLGYSQGAAATVDAMKKLSTDSPEFSAIKGAFLIGNPQRLPGKKSNTDQNGGDTTKSATGISARFPGAGIPADWDNSGKVLDVCFTGDGVCSGFTINAPHLAYITSQSVQNMGADFMKSKLA